MKTLLPPNAKTYLAALCIAAFGLFVYLFFITNWAEVNWASFLFFLFLIFLSASFPVNLPYGVVVSVSFAVTFAAVLIFQPFIVVTISVLGDFLSLRKGRSPVQYLFNAAQLTLTTGIAALAFWLLRPGELDFSLYYLTAALVPLLLCFLLNSFFVTLIVALTRQERPYSIWLTNIKWSAPNFISMAPLGLITALIYQNIGMWGIVLFSIPMLIARQSFISYMNMRQTFLDTVRSLSATIDAKDPYTKGHSFRVASYSTALARELGWSEEKVELLQYAALIHDLGKVAISEGILKKEGKLTASEFARMKEHSFIGSTIIKDIKFLAGGADIIKHHHERWDGQGYPDGLKGELIPEGARILAVADAFDAMTSDRSYRQALDISTAIQEIKEGAGTQFDPRIAEVFIRIIPRLNLEEKTKSSGDFIYNQAIVAETES